MDGEIHSLTKAGEPDVPVKNVIIKDGEPVYDKSDRFGKNIEFNSEEIELLDEEKFDIINSSTCSFGDTVIIKKGKNRFMFSDKKGKAELETLKDAIVLFKDINEY